MVDISEVARQVALTGTYDPAATPGATAPPGAPAAPPAQTTPPTAASAAPPPAAPPTTAPQGVVPAPVVPPTASQVLNSPGFIGQLATPATGIEAPVIGPPPNTDTGITYVTSQDELLKRVHGGLSVDDINRDIAMASEGARTTVGETVPELIDKYYPPGTMDMLRREYGGNPYLYGLALNGLVKNVAEVRGAREQELRSDVAVETVKQNWSRLGADQRNAFTNWFNVTNAGLASEKQLKLQEALGRWNLAQNWAQIQVSKYGADINRGMLDVQRLQTALTALAADAKFDANGNLISTGKGGKGLLNPSEMLKGVQELGVTMKAWQEADDKDEKTILFGILNAQAAILRQYSSDPDNVIIKMITGLALGDDGALGMLVQLTSSDPSLAPYATGLASEDPKVREESLSYLIRHGTAIFQKKAAELYPDDARKQAQLVQEFMSIMTGTYLLNTQGNKTLITGGSGTAPMSFGESVESLGGEISGAYDRIKNFFSRYRFRWPVEKTTPYDRSGPNTKK